MKPKNIAQLRDKMFQKYPSLHPANNSRFSGDAELVKSANNDLESRLRNGAYYALYNIETSVSNKELPHYNFVTASHSHLIEPDELDDRDDSRREARRSIAEKALLESNLADKICGHLAAQQKARDKNLDGARGNGMVPVIDPRSQTTVFYDDIPRSDRDKLNREYRNEMADIMRDEQSEYLEVLVNDFPEIYAEKKDEYQEQLYEHYNEQGKPVPVRLMIPPEQGEVDEHGALLPNQRPPRDSKSSSRTCVGTTALGFPCRRVVAKGNLCRDHR